MKIKGFVFCRAERMDFGVMEKDHVVPFSQFQINGSFRVRKESDWRDKRLMIGGSCANL